MAGGGVHSQGVSFRVGTAGADGDCEGDGGEVSEFVDPWVAEAREKNLPEEFIERLAESDAITEKEKARIVSSVRTAADLAEKRRQAIEHGRVLGEDEAHRRNEVGEWAASRVKRAMAYAAWEFDGKPLGEGARYRAEFGIPEPMLADPRVGLGSDFKREKR